MAWYYDVTYWTERDGLVLYSATENLERKNAYEQVANGIALFAAFSIMVSFGIPLPVLA